MPHARYLKTDIATDALADLKMAFLSGPRQVGKTTLARAFIRHEQNEFSWDSFSFQVRWNRYPISSVSARGPGPILLDEVHKDKKWKSKLKGLYDSIGKSTPILVTGSGKLDVYRKGGDSMLGRYIPYRLHPFSVAECGTPAPVAELFTRSEAKYPWDDLMRLGGFPEPFLKGSQAKAKRWSRLRRDLLIHEDLRDFKGVMDLHAFRLLCEILPEKVGGLLSMNSLKEDVGVAYATVRSWLEVLDSLYFTFRIRPYSTRIARALKAETKLYLFDILQIPSENRPKRLENLAALHLLKACHYWTDTAQGNFELSFVRDKEKREVDFLVLKDRKPWILIECKSNQKSISNALTYFNRILRPDHCFQLVDDPGFDREYPAFQTRVISYEKFFSYWI